MLRNTQSGHAKSNGRGPMAEKSRQFGEPEEKMRRTNSLKKKKCSIEEGSPAAAAERAGRGPKMTVEGDFLVVKWTKEQATEAMDSAGMTLAEVFKTHLLPRLEATKTITIKYGGEVTQ